VPGGSGANRGPARGELSCIDKKMGQENAVENRELGRKAIHSLKRLNLGGVPPRELRVRSDRREIKGSWGRAREGEKTSELSQGWG